MWYCLGYLVVSVNEGETNRYSGDRRKPTIQKPGQRTDFSLAWLEASISF
jgi:hypothetical protein